MQRFAALALDACRAGIAVAVAAVTIAAAGRDSLARVVGWRTEDRPKAPAAKVPAPTRISKPSMPSRAVELTAATVVDAFFAVERGDGLSPDTCDALLRRGWVEWVDFASGLPIDENSPRSLLRMTTQGRARLEGSHTLVNFSAVPTVPDAPRVPQCTTEFCDASLEREDVKT
jgi:hypothetical protein